MIGGLTTAISVTVIVIITVNRCSLYQPKKPFMLKVTDFAYVLLVILLAC